MHRVRLLRLLLKVPTGFSLLATLGFAMMAVTTVTTGPLHWDFGQIPLAVQPAKPIASAPPIDPAGSSKVSTLGTLDEWLGLPAPGLIAALGNEFIFAPEGRVASPLAPEPTGGARASPRHPVVIGAPLQPDGDDSAGDSPTGPLDTGGNSDPAIASPTGGEAAPLPALLPIAGGAGPLLAGFPVTWDPTPPALSPIGPTGVVPPPPGPLEDGPGPVAEYLPPNPDLGSPVIQAPLPRLTEPGQPSPNLVSSVPEPRGIGLFAFALLCLVALVKRHRAERT